MIKVSVIVPVYNVEAYLETCLEALVKQSLKEMEIIVVNDGTQDDSQKIIDRYAKQYPDLIKAYQKENGGLSSARNYGIERAQGAYLAFADSDDTVSETMYASMYQKAVEGNFDLVVCDFYEIRSGKAIACSCHVEQDLYGKKAIQAHMISVYPSAWNKLYKHSLFENLRFKEGIWFEDVELSYRLLPYVNSIGVVHQPFYRYLIRTNSISNSVDPRIYHCIDNWNGILAFYKEKHLYESYREELEYCYVRYLFATFIKAAAKYDRSEYRKAVVRAIDEVNRHFPDYRSNRYLQEHSAKNWYLKRFNRAVAWLAYVFLAKEAR